MFDGILAIVYANGVVDICMHNSDDELDGRWVWVSRRYNCRWIYQIIIGSNTHTFVYCGPLITWLKIEWIHIIHMFLLCHLSAPFFLCTTLFSYEEMLVKLGKHKLVIAFSSRCPCTYHKDYLGQNVSMCRCITGTALSALPKPAWRDSCFRMS